MKKTFTFAVMAVLMACYCHAAIYMVGNDPFGNWNPAAGVEMTDNGDGIYTHSAAINGTVWFVFADGLDSDWTTFNNDFRYGPSNGDQTVTVGSWISTQKAGDHGAYQFTGSGETYSFTFDNNYKRFKVEGYVAPTLDEYTVAGAPVEVFGSEWDINNPDNLMTLGDDGRYYWTKTGVSLTAGYVIEFKVVRNHDWTGSWPDSNYFWHADGAGIYDLTITFDPVSHEIQFTPTLVEDVEPVRPDDVYILGEVNYMNWTPYRGLRMRYDSSDKIYSAQFTAKVSDKLLQLAYFGLTRKLASPTSSTPWDDIAEYRFGPVSDETFIVTEDKLGQYLPLATDGSYNSFGIPEGTWTLKVDLVNNRFCITGQAHPVGNITYTIAGPQEVFGTDWDATDAANDMTMDHGLYVWKKQNVSLKASGFGFKVVGNHDWNFFEWPEGYGNNYSVSVPHNGAYNVTITFDPNADAEPAITCTLEEVKPAVPGDLNGDGEVTVADVNLLIDAILTSKLTDEYDFNGDGETNVADVSALINLLLSGNKNDKELTGEIVIAPDENCVHVYYTGDERVTLSVLLDGAAMPLQDGCFYLDEYGEYTIEAIAKARGYKDLKTTLVYVWEDDPEPEVTETPVILVDEHDDCVVVTAVGKGDVYLYIDGELMENPCTITRTSESITIVIVATAQEPGKLISQEAVRYYEIAPIADQPDPKEQGVWVVVLDKDDKEVWFEMHEDDNGYFSAMMPLYSDIYGFETPTGELVARYHFMIDGVLYGAGWDMEPGVGATTWSGYVEAKYLVEWSDYNFSLRTGFNYTLSVYKTDLFCAVSTGGWCGKQ